jgi:ubiquitin fusion degradation protein 1
MEATPGGGGINVLDTDLEVDFAPPVGYIEPERPKPAPPSTMASKLKIDLNSSSPGSSRPSSSLGGGFVAPGGTAVSKGGDHWESFKGKGETLAGRKTKGKGISHRGVEAVGEDSKIIRTEWVSSNLAASGHTNDYNSQQKIINNSSTEADVKVPAALNLPFGKLFFGFNVVAYTPPEIKAPSSPGSSPPSAVSLNIVLPQIDLTIPSALFLRFGQYPHGPASHITPRCKRKGKGEIICTVATERTGLGHWKYAGILSVYPHSTKLPWARSWWYWR